MCLFLLYNISEIGGSLNGFDRLVIPTCKHGIHSAFILSRKFQSVRGESHDTKAHSRGDLPDRPRYESDQV